MNTAEKIGLALRACREQAKLTMRDAAKLIGASEGYSSNISRMESGEIEPSVSTLLRFATAYGTTVTAILRKAGIK